MAEYQTRFGSLSDYEKGGVTIINDDPKNYVFSNVFEVADKSSPYERVAVAKNFEYVIESVRAEGVSSWYSAAHDEFAVAMDYPVTVELVKLDDLLDRADFVTVHAPLVPSTKHLFSTDAFAKMKKSARLICAARGGSLPWAREG